MTRADTALPIFRLASAARARSYRRKPTANCTESATIPGATGIIICVEISVAGAVRPDSGQLVSVGALDELVQRHGAERFRSSRFESRHSGV